MHNKRLDRDDILKIEVLLRRGLLRLSVLTINSGPELLPLHLGALIPAVNVIVLQLDVVLPAAVAALHLLDVAAATSLPAKMIAETETATETTIVEIEPTGPAVQMTGKKSDAPIFWR
jgi:hypothetical protein